VKWENIEWMSKRPLSSETLHCTVYADNDTGRTLTQSESPEKMLRMQETMQRAERESGSTHLLICMYNADFRTNTDHMNQSDAREFLQQHIDKLRNAYQLFFGKNQLFL